VHAIHVDGLIESEKASFFRKKIREKKNKLLDFVFISF
jgi:hypothetical protein